MNKVFLVSLALLLVISVGVVGCGDGDREYKLTMAVNPAGAGTATDLTGTSPYKAGTRVSIRAMGVAGYRFSHWSAPAGTFFDPNDETTTFTMPAQDVKVTAHFVGPLDHFTGYWTYWETAPYVGEDVYLEDQFGAVEATVGYAMAFANPARKVHGEVTTPIWNPDHHFTVYELYYEKEPQTWFVEVTNQFGTQELTVRGPVALAVPTQKVEPTYHHPPAGLDHFLLYEVIEGQSVDVVVSLNDQFAIMPNVWVYRPLFLANPVRKTHGNTATEIKNPEAHGVIYSIGGEYFEREVQVVNQFGEQTFDVQGPSFLAVPSQKTIPAPPGPAFAAVLGDYQSQLTNLLLANDISAVQRGWDVIPDIANYEVVVVNMPYDQGGTTFLELLEAASDNEVGVVFTSSFWVGGPWGISLLEWYLGDPDGQDNDWGKGNVYYKVAQAHPIFAGWDVDDEITIITGGDCDHAWFWGYSGQTIAKVGSVDSGIQGDAVAVGTYGGSTHVLLASLGPQYYTNVPHWTDAGKTIFINAVRFAGGLP